MGTAMAKRLVASGHEVVVTNRTRAKAEVLGSLGASVVDTPRDLDECEIIFVMVSADAQLLEVVSGPRGVLSKEAGLPAIIVDCSTVSVETSARVREACEARGVDFLAAPVSGNPKVVASGQLTLAVSGDEDAFEKAYPLLVSLGHGVSYVGAGELARLVKICHNMFLGVVTQSLAEITVLAERGGVTRRAFLEFLNNSVMGSTFTRYKTPAFVNLDFTPTFTPVLLKKDFELGLGEAKRTGVPMPLAALCTQIVTSAIGAGYTEEDFAVLLLEAARGAGLSLESENASIDDGLGLSS
jgi:3-hydroxyisobutyrate dehydrogenase-like beta-hydroxyacid dehydrogenase